MPKEGHHHCGGRTANIGIFQNFGTICETLRLEYTGNTLLSKTLGHRVLVLDLDSWNWGATEKKLEIMTVGK